MFQVSVLNKAGGFVLFAASITAVQLTELQLDCKLTEKGWTCTLDQFTECLQTYKK